MTVATADTDIQERAKSLISLIWKRHDSKYGSTLMGCSIYDTAWVSMISKSNDGKDAWLFPQTFDYVLDTQTKDGDWVSYASDIDGILNTAASLLTIKAHMKHPYQLVETGGEDLTSRRERGLIALERLLQNWDVDACVHVGFEILVPKLLSMLEKDGKQFCFPGRDRLMALREEKLRGFRPDVFHANFKTTGLYSLEAFDGVDFNRIRHHLSQGAIMGCPSSTACYLINVSSWDEEAEAYLRHVVEHGPGGGKGGVPGAFPTTNFEFSWVLSTMIEAGYSAEELGLEETGQMARILAHEIDSQSGLVGFSPSVGADSDDTSKALLSLKLLGKDIDVAPMLKEFEGDTHFKTYLFERTPSFSANCNVLKALLSLPDIMKYLPQIQKVAQFLSNWWWSADAKIPDKWNTTFGYNTMLMVESFVKLLELWNEGQIIGLDEDLVRAQIPVALLQALRSFLLLQHEDGSWGVSGEETAYAIISISALAKLPIFVPLREEVNLAVERGRDSLLTSTSREPHFLWVGKTSYSSETLSETYILAALRTKIGETLCGEMICSLVGFSTNAMDKFCARFGNLGSFTTNSPWEIRLSFIESQLFLPMLDRTRHLAFPSFATEVEERTLRYLQYVPITWVLCNNMNKTFASSEFIFSMMVISYLGYKVDEYIETVATVSFSHDLDALSEFIESILAGADELPELDIQPHLILDISYFLKQFINYVMGLTLVVQASPYSQHRLRYHMKDYLLAHVQHARDSTALSKQTLFTLDASPNVKPAPTFHHWVHGYPAASTSCSYALALVVCHTSMAGGALESAEQKYLIEDFSFHLSAVTRLDNDLGSMSRDEADGNLNSINFPEFTSELDRKASLLHMTRYERRCVLLSMDSLAKVCREKKSARGFRMLELFRDVCDLYGQIYLREDLSVL